MPCLRTVLFITLSLLAMPALALDPPQTAPILTVDGAIGVTNDGDRAVFDRAMMHDLEWREIDSYTDFSDGIERFAGPSLASLLEALGVTSGELRAVALDDYVIRIPVGDAAEFGVILALQRNGKPMRVREKGPIWVIYPAEVPEDVNELHSSRMIWQLTHITVEP